MKQIPDAFYTLMDQLEEKLSALLLLVEKEKSAALASNGKKLHTLSLEKAALLGRIRQIEQNRLEILKNHANHLSPDPRQLTLTRMATLVGPEEAVALKARQKRLTEITRTIQQINQDNQHRVGYALTVMQGSIRLIRRLALESPVYSRSGKTDARMGSGMYLSDAV